MNQEKQINELLDFSIINVNKPAGLTSSETIKKIKDIFKIKKAGHFGTLDTNTSGVLPIAFNKATRLSRYFLASDKEYFGKMYLHSDITEKEIESLFNNFTGKIIQKPPTRSSVKRINREREVYEFKILKKEKKIVEFFIRVSSGTYIRKLIHDIGTKINGAHMIELKRTRAGIFSIENSYTLEQLENIISPDNTCDLKKILISADIIKKIIPQVFVKEEIINELFNGKPLMKKDIIDKIPENDLLSVFYKSNLIGIYRKINQKPDIIAKPEVILKK
jgi:H/ACA ribonucleoprotein complex subunit 4